MARQYYPRVKVTLLEVFSGSNSYDITDQLGEGCQIRTHKSILEPAGTFSISFVDRPFQGDGNDSLYGRIAPMDAIQIEVAHDGSQPLKVIFRGLVSSIRRDEAMGGDGKPLRRVTVSGHDIGKVWTTQMIHFTEFPTEQALVISGLAIYLKYLGPTPKDMSGEEFLTKFTTILNDHVQIMLADSKLAITLEPDAQGSGTVPVARFQSAEIMDKPFYEFMSGILDRGWFYELWMDDPGDGPVQVHWRELWSGPDSGITITNDDVASVSVWRDDSRVSNWYWAWPASFALLNQLGQKIASRLVGQPVQDGRADDFTAERFFGWRKLEAQVSLYPPGWIANANAVKKEPYQASREPAIDWITDRTKLLRKLNENNARLESCAIRASGNEHLRPGQWITYQKSDIAFEYYMVSVSHEIQLFGVYTTSFEGARGELISGLGIYKDELDLKGALRD